MSTFYHFKNLLAFIIANWFFDSQKKIKKNSEMTHSGEGERELTDIIITQSNQ